MTAYYNEFDPYAAQWLRNLIAAGHIAPGYVDDRSIKDVKAEDLKGFTQVHFFAGIGVWSHALRLAGWPDDRPVWTGSCPCQPFSQAGKGEGIYDPRHLWPDFFRLIAAHRPVAVFGEQVASRDGLAWLDIVHADLEGAGYAVGAVDTCAAGFGAPHIRQRLYFMADAECDAAESGRLAIESTEGVGAAGAGTHAESGRCSVLGRLEHPASDGRQQRRAEPSGRGATGGCSAHGVAQGDTNDAGSQGRGVSGADSNRNGGRELATRTPSATNGFWNPCDWLPCIDGKARPVEPGTFPLAHGAPARVGRLRAYGNAINARQAAGFVEAYLLR